MSVKNNDGFNILLSRKPLLLLFLTGLFLLTIVLDIILFHRLLPGFTIDPEQKIIFYLVLAFLIGFGGAIMGQLLVYLARPPVMLRASREGIAFGTGARYQLRTIPWKHIGEITIRPNSAAQSADENARAGLYIGLRRPSDMTDLKTTSLGIVYDGTGVTLGRFYLSCNSSEAAVILKGMKKKYDEIR